MKNKIITYLAIVISLIFIGSVFYLTFNLYSEYSHGEERTKRQYEHIVNTIKETEDIKTLQRAIGNLNNYSSIEIKKDGGKIFSYGDIHNDSENASQSKMIKSFESDFVNANGSRITINANLYLLKPGTIFSKARISFIIILVTTAFTVLLIIYITIIEKEKYTLQEDFQSDDKNEANSENATDNEPYADNEYNIKENAAVSVSNSNSDSDSNIIDEKTESNESQENTTAETETENQNKDMAADYEKSVQDEDSYPPVTVLTENNNSNLSENTPSQELNLYSDFTGVGLEKNLEARVETELTRAISSENDLTLFIIRIPDTERTSTLCKEIADKLVESFMYKDLVFEYGTDCFAAIKLNTNLDEGLNFSDELIHGISDILLKENKSCYIGLSSRAQRMVAAKRLITEASEALVHAQQDPNTPVTAFRVNTEKYMKLISQ